MHTGSGNRWLRHAAAAVARTLLATLVGLLVWTVLPVVLGWQPSVVMSGSMEPAIRVGDVVLTREVPVDELQPGHVLLVDDPARPGHRVMHRYDHEDDDGGLVLRGDANPQHDSTPVMGEDVLGVGILRVPWIGQPYVWMAEGRHLPVGLTVLGLLVLAALSPIRERNELTTPIDSDAGHGTAADDVGEGPDDGDRDRHATSPDDPAAADDLDTSPDDGAPVSPRQPVASGRHAVAVLAVALVAVGGSAVAITTPVTAGFTDTVTMAATFTTGTWADGAEEELTTEVESDPSNQPSEPEPGDLPPETEASEPAPGAEVSEPPTEPEASDPAPEPKVGEPAPGPELGDPTPEPELTDPAPRAEVSDPTHASG